MNTLVSDAPFQILLSDNRVLRSRRPEDFVRAYAVAKAVGLPHPSPATVSWLSGMTQPYDESSSYWQPYAVVGQDVYIKSWARGAYGYERRNAHQYVPIALVDPSVWYASTLAAIAELVMPERVWQAFDLAHDQTDPSGPYSDEVIALWTAVRQAQQSNRVYVDAPKIKRLCERHGVAPQ